VALMVGPASGVLPLDSLPRDEATRKRLEKILTHLNTVFGAGVRCHGEGKDGTLSTRL
jgi:hypothetical protein